MRITDALIEAPPEAGALLRAAARAPLLPAAERQRGPVLGRLAVEALLPHRDPFLLIDRITALDRDSATIVCRYDLARAAPVFAGHYPDHPLFPGVLQVEAVAQAGVCLVRLLDRATLDGAPRRQLTLTHILSAHFAWPVVPGGELEIVARSVPDGLFTILVGQCLQRDKVCSTAAVRGIEKEVDE